MWSYSAFNKTLCMSTEAHTFSFNLPDERGIFLVTILRSQNRCGIENDNVMTMEMTVL